MLNGACMDCGDGVGASFGLIRHKIHYAYFVYTDVMQKVAL